MKTIPIILLAIWSVCPLFSQSEVDKEIDAQFSLKWVDLNFTSDHGVYLYDSNMDKDGFLWITAANGPFLFDGQKSNNLFENPNYLADYPINNYETTDLIGSAKLDSFTLTFDRLNNTIIYSHQENKTLDTIIVIDDRFEISLRPKGAFVERLSFVMLDKNRNEYIVCSIDVDGNITEHFRHTFTPGDNTSRLKSIFQYQNHIITKTEYKELYHINTHLDKVDSIIHTPLTPLSNNFHFYNEEFIINQGNKLYYHDIDSFLQFRTVTIPNEITASLVTLKFVDHYLIAGNYSHLFIYDLRDGTYQNLSEEYLKIKKENGLNFLGDILSDVFSDGKNYYILLRNNLLQLKPKKKEREDLFVPMPGINPAPSMRGLTTDDNDDLYTTYYYGLAVKKKNEVGFIDYAGPKGLNEAIKKPFSLTSYHDELFVSNLMIDKQSITPINPGRLQYMRHAVNIVDHDSLFFIQFYSDYLHKYDIINDTISSILINGLSDTDLTNDLILDPMGRGFWIGCSLDGVNLISRKGKLIKNLPIDVDYDCGDTNDLHIVDNTMYAATNKGLVSIDLSTYKTEFFPLFKVDKYNIKKAESMFSLIYAEDKLIIGCVTGLYAFDLQSKQFLMLENDHPLMGLEYNRKAAIEYDSSYYFGTTNGLYKFSDSDLNWSANSPEIKPIDITTLTYRNDNKNKTYPISRSSFQFAPNTSNIEIDFSSPNLDVAVYYSYRITSIDSSWSNYSQENTINIFKLPKGDHTLEIRASALPLDQNIKYKTIFLSQKGLWYKSIWAYILYGFIIAAIVYFIYRYRLQQIIKYQNLRTQISSDLHDDVGSILTAVAMQSEILSIHAAPEKASKFNKLSDLARQAMSRMRDTVWAIDARKDNVESLVYRMIDHLSDSLEGHQLKHHLQYQESQFNHTISPDVRQALYLIFKEAVTNAAKHSNGTDLYVDIDIQKNNHFLSIRDNGNLATDLKRNSGLGLDNMKMRANKIGATFEISQDQGFSITVQSQ
ncbi:histidine kinase [Saprospiraceae bacterium]|nr:histidine kinase [Saprospiraceae bacterium]